MFYRLTSSIVLAALLAACGGGGGSGGAPTPTAPTALKGLVQDASGQPVPSASVSVAGQTATTAADGRFSVSLAAASTTTVVLVKKNGFATNAKEAPVVQGNTTDITIKLFADQLRTTFSAAAGSSLNVNSATVQISPNAIQTASGAAYTGTVNIAASYFTPDNLEGVQAFPAPYAGVDGGAQVLLRTVGVMEVKLSDAVGNPLQLKAGAPATLIFPASTVSANTATVPLWYYDEATKNWVREGQVTRQTNGSYQGAVAHFTLWNVDIPIPNPATIKGCFRDAQGQPVTRLVGWLRGSGWLGLGGVPGPDGNFEARVPSGIPIELYSLAAEPVFAPFAIAALSPGEVRQLNCVVVANPPTVISLVVPTIPSFSSSTGSVGSGTTTVSPFAGNYAGSYSGVETGTFSVTINNLGVVSGQAVSTTFGGAVSPVSGSVAANGALALTATSGTAGAASFTGTITATGAVSGTWVYTGTTTGGAFSGQRL